MKRTQESEGFVPVGSERKADTSLRSNRASTVQNIFECLLMAEIIVGVVPFFWAVRLMVIMAFTLQFLVIRLGVAHGSAAIRRGNDVRYTFYLTSMVYEKYTSIGWVVIPIALIVHFFQSLLTSFAFNEVPRDALLQSAVASILASITDVAFILYLRRSRPD